METLAAILLLGAGSLLLYAQMRTFPFRKAEVLAKIVFENYLIQFTVRADWRYNRKPKLFMPDYNALAARVDSELNTVISGMNSAAHGKTLPKEDVHKFIVRLADTFATVVRPGLPELSISLSLHNLQIIATAEGGIVISPEA